MERRTQFSIWYFLFVLLAIMWVRSMFLAPHVAQIPYSKFKELLQQKQVENLVISREYIYGKAPADLLAATSDADKTGKTLHDFGTVRVEDPELTAELEANGIQFSGKIDNNFLGTLLSWLLPLLLFFLLWSYLFRRMGAGMGQNMMAIGKSKAKVFIQHEIKEKFADVAGIDEAKEELREVVEYLRTPEKFQRLGGKIPKGVLLVGAPGTGKTLLAKAVAGEAGVPFFSMNGSEFVEMFVGVGAARVRDLFNQASQKAPCIIFIDELDALGKARGLNPLGGHDEREQTLNQLLVEMDGFSANSGVIIMGATNRPETLDPALMRPGRFDRQVVVDRPDINGREAILKVHAAGVKLAVDVDLHQVAARTPGFVGADLANLVNEAALLAARRGSNAVSMANFDEAIERIVGGLEKKSRVMRPKVKERVAYHEAGHALIAGLLPNADPVHKVSIIPRGVAALGYTLQLPTEDSYLLTRSELLDRLAVLLGGRAAEELIYGEVSTGAQNDLQRATDIARSMIKEYGMSKALGPVAFEPRRRALFLNTDFSPEKNYSEQTAQAIDSEIKQIILGTYEKVKALLQTHRSVLDRVASLLLEKEAIEGEELRRIIAASEATDVAGINQSRRKKRNPGGQTNNRLLVHNHGGVRRKE